MFALEGRSINAVCRWLSGAAKRGEPTPFRGRAYHPYVRRQLSNAKYVGGWSFGHTRTLRRANGKKRAVPAEPADVVTVARPGLAIVPRDLFDAAQQKLAELAEIYRPRAGGRAGASAGRTCTGASSMTGCCSAGS